MTSFNLGPNGDQVLQHFGTQAGCVEDQQKKVTGGASQSVFWQPSWLMQIVPQRFFDLHFGEPAARAPQTTLLEYPHGAMPPTLRWTVSETVWFWSCAGGPEGPTALCDGC